MPTSGRQVIVGDASRIRTWRLPGGEFDRTLVPFLMADDEKWPASRPRRRVVPGFTARSDGRLIIANKKPNSCIRLQTWDGETGRLVTTFTLPKTESETVAVFSYGGDYLLTASAPTSGA